MEWLLYAGRELITNDERFGDEHYESVNKFRDMIDSLRRRVRQGCKEELLPLVSLKGIGRSRARTLKDFGIDNPVDFLKLSDGDLDRLRNLRGWGNTIIENLIKEVRKTKNDSEYDVIDEKRPDDKPLTGERLN